MARLTIEEKYWTDPRRDMLSKLVGDSMLADAVMIRAWRSAQTYWGEGKRPMPLDVFETIPHSRSIVEAKFAIVEADKVYVKGVAEHHSWLAEKRQAASAGGKKSAASRKKKYGTAQPDPPILSKQRRSTPEANSKTLEPSGSGSDSGSNKIPNTSYSGESLPAIAEARGKNAVALWMEAYHRRYGTRYSALGKDHGTLVGLEKTYNREQIEILFAAYLAMKDPLYEKAHHPLSLFFRDLPKISNAAQTGKDPSAPAEIDYSKVFGDSDAS